MTTDTTLAAIPGTAAELERRVAAELREELDAWQDRAFGLEAVLRDLVAAVGKGSGWGPTVARARELLDDLDQSDAEALS